MSIVHEIAALKSDLPTSERSSHRPSREGGNFYTPRNDEFYSRFAYDKIDRTSKSIRLLEVLPDLEDGLISCLLLPAQAISGLQNRYVALSYCAGDPRKTQTILVNGMQFNVFANLGHALKEVITYWSGSDESAFNVLHHLHAEGKILPAKSRSRTLIWIDQICINQMDVSERSHQVGLMRDVYSRAVKVLICLSVPEQPDHTTSRVRWVDLPPTAFSLIDVDVEGLKPSESSVQQGVKQRVIRLPCLLFRTMDLGYRITFSEMIHSLRSPWWRRAWVHQEFVVSREAVFLYHGSSMHWKDLADYRSQLKEFESPDMMSWVHELSIGDLWRSGNIESISNIIKSKLDHHSQGHRDIVELLSESHQFKATDPRDRIYALLGLTSRLYDLQIDYSHHNTPEMVMCSIAREIVRIEKNVNFIHFAPEFASTADAKSSTRTQSLPSWIPNWTTEPLLTTKDAHAAMRHQLQHPICTDGLSLCVPGRMVDTIASRAAKGFTFLYANEVHREEKTHRQNRESDLREHYRLIFGGNQQGLPRLDDSDIRLPPIDDRRSFPPQDEINHQYSHLWNHDMKLYRRVHLELDRSGGDVDPKSILRAFKTSNSHPEASLVVVVSPDVCVGDQVWVLAGTRCPVILRPRESSFCLISNVYASIEKLDGLIREPVSIKDQIQSMGGADRAIVTFGYPVDSKRLGPVRKLSIV